MDITQTHESTKEISQDDSAIRREKISKGRKRVNCGFASETELFRACGTLSKSHQCAIVSSCRTISELRSFRLFRGFGSEEIRAVGRGVLRISQLPVSIPMEKNYPILYHEAKIHGQLETLCYEITTNNKNVKPKKTNNNIG